MVAKKQNFELHLPELLNWSTEYRLRIMTPFRITNQIQQASMQFILWNLFQKISVNVIWVEYF